MFIKPCFYDKFICKADKCTDTCCAGWEIDIDKAYYEYYMSLKGPFADEIKKGINIVDGQPCFKLCSDERCHFLQEDGLCRIYSVLGEEALCDVCSEHPRFYDEYDTVTEAGLGLCCEKVCELIQETEKLDFIYEDESENLDEDISVLLDIREKCFEIINSDCDFAYKVKMLLDYSEKVQTECFDFSANAFQFADKKSAIDFVLDLYRKTDPINDKWTDYIKNLFDNRDLILDIAYEPDCALYEKLIVYIIYRHFMKCRFDGCIAAVVRFAVCAVVFFYLCSCYCFAKKGCVEKDDITDIVKRWSQQIEYSEENVDLCLTILN